MTFLNEIKNKLERRIGERERLSTQIDKTSICIGALKKEKETVEQASLIIQAVTQQTQEQLQYHLSELVTLALQSILPEPYDFKLNFTSRRNKTEVDIVLVRDSKEFDPLTCLGGGVIDFISFALRITLWSITSPHRRAVLILDEPFKHLSKDLHGKASRLLRLISSKLGMQIIMVSHSPDLIEAADKVFEVKQIECVRQGEVIK